MLDARTAAGLLAVSCLVGACQDTFIERDEAGLRTLSATLKSKAQGKVVVPVDISEGETAFQLTAVLEEDQVGFIRTIIAPDGVHVFRAEEWWEADETRSNAVFADNVLTVNWPIAADDTPLSPGRWKVDLGVENRQQEVPTEVVVKSDDDFTQGSVIATVHLAESLLDNQSLAAGLTDAIEGWVEIYASIGIALTVNQVRWDNPNRLQAPGFGDGDVYEAVSNSTPYDTVDVLVVPFIAGGAGIYGISGGIPGPVAPTRRSAVVLSASEALGADALLSDTDVRILSETLAHEVGHYLGLFHPVETSWNLFDSLSDTPTCSDERSCALLLGRNLMFPTPVCEVDPCTVGDLVPQRDVSPEQQGVLHRYVGVH